MSPAWISFFSASAGAAATLAGLIFVALSVNISHVLKYEHLPARAGAAVASLILVLTASLAALAPQPLSWLGAEVLALTAVCCLLEANAARQSVSGGKRHGRPPHELYITVTFSVARMAIYLVAGALLTLGAPAGVGWLAGGSLLVFIISVVGAWIMLVEILR